MTWLVSLSIVIAMTYWLEHLSRSGGHRPSIVDDPILWSLERRKVDADPGLVVFLGDSRLALGYSPRAFASTAPELRGLQLAISDHLPLGVLEDLANDEEFRGVAVLDVIESEIGDSLLRTDAEAYLARADTLWRVPGALTNRVLASQAQSRLAVLGVGGRRIVTSLAGKRRWPKPAWVAIDRERTSSGDYRLAEPAALRAKAEKRLAGFPAPVSPEQWLAILARDLEPLVQRIRARGGDVVVTHMPVSGGLAAILDAQYPRQRYWDVFAARSAAHVLHFRDIPEMAKLECPDEMHLDQRDQAAFTRSLVEAMREHGIFRNRKTSM
jgi:hypothetical protein